MAVLRVAFVGFGLGFDPEASALTNALRARRDIEIVPVGEAQLLLYDKHGHDHRPFVGTKVFCTAENLRPRWTDADFCIGHDYDDDPRYLRLPFWAMVALEDAKRPPLLGPATPWAEREFCACIYSHPGPPERGRLFDALDGYRPVTSPGKFRNNHTATELAPRRGDWRRSKIDYLQRFRFVIACENSSHPGYTTEKLYDALVAGAIPVYWGDPRVGEDFDERAFVRWDGATPLDQIADRIRRLDADPTAADAMRTLAPAHKVDVATWAARLEAFLDTAARAALAGRPGTAARLRATQLVARYRLATAASGVRRRLGR